jgi:hypothetical protein
VALDDPNGTVTERGGKVAGVALGPVLFMLAL